MTRTIVQSDHFNALYTDGALTCEGKPDYVDAETLARTFPEAAIYLMPDDVYDEILSGLGYPPCLRDVPLSRCEKIR